MGHGRTGTARVTGSRAIISPRLVVAPGRGGLRGRSGLASTTDDARSAGRRHGPARRPPATRPVYRLLLMKGLTPTEAASLTAFICGLPTSDLHWSLKQVNQLLFLRRMRQIGPVRRHRRQAPTARTDPSIPPDRDGDPPPAVAIDRPKRRRASSRRRFGFVQGSASRGAPGSHLLLVH